MSPVDLRVHLCALNEQTLRLLLLLSDGRDALQQLHRISEKLAVLEGHLGSVAAHELREAVVAFD